MVKTGSAYWAILLAGTALLSIVWAGTNEVTVILALLAGYFFGISSPESKMNAEFAKHLNNSKMYSRGLIPQNDHNNKYEYSSEMKKMNPYLRRQYLPTEPIKNQEEE